MNNIIKAGEENTSPDFVIRELKSTDVWNFTRVISKIGIREFVKSLDPQLLKASSFKPPETINKKGERVPLPRSKWNEAQIQAELNAEIANDQLLWNILGLIIDNIGHCEREVNQLLADGIGEDIAYIADMNAADYMDLLVQYISREEFKDFFMQAWNSLNRISPSRKSFGAAMEALTK